MKADNELDLELRISKFLRAGVVVAGILMLIGWLSNLILHGSNFESLKVYESISLGDSLRAAVNAGAWGDLCAYFGLLTLISLPLIRVFLTSIIFLKEKEYVLAGIAGFVLIALIVSCSLGIDL